jgi:hypothetical protein
LNPAQENSSTRPYLEKSFTKIGLVEWLKVKTMSSSPSTKKKKMRCPSLPESSVVLVSIMGEGVVVVAVVLEHSVPVPYLHGVTRVLSIINFSAPPDAEVLPWQDAQSQLQLSALLAHTCLAWSLWSWVLCISNATLEASMC